MGVTNHHSEFGEEQTARNDGSQTSMMLLKKLINRNESKRSVTLGTLVTLVFESSDVPIKRLSWCNKKQNHIMDSFPGQPGTRKVKPIWILMQQDVMHGSGISWTIYESFAPCSR